MAIVNNKMKERFEFPEYKNDHVESLLGNILRQAKEDYINGLLQERHPRKNRRAQMIRAKKESGASLRHSESSYLSLFEKNRQLKEDAEAFFESDWCFCMTGVEGSVIMERLAREI